MADPQQQVRRIHARRDARRGLLMLATQGRFNAGDPAHLDAALAIHRALEPLWQPLDLPDF